MTISFQNLKDDLWLDLKRIDVTTTWVDVRLAPSNHAEWMVKTTLLSTDSFASISPDIYDGAELYYSRYYPERHVELRALCHNPTKNNQYIFLDFDVHRVHFKSGVVLKTKDEICHYFFPIYKTIDRDEWRREQRRLDILRKEKNIRVVSKPQFKRR